MKQRPISNIAMARALDEARRAAERDEVPVGAAITDAEGAVIAAAGNAMRRQNDPTAHAEILVLRAAASEVGRIHLTDCDLATTLEPCAMCAAAISLARIRRLYVAAPDPKRGAVEHGVRFFASPSCHHAPEIYLGIAEKEASLILKNFFALKR